MARPDGLGWLDRFRFLRQVRRRDPYYRFASIPELRAAAAAGERFDVNRASLDDWLRLPGLSIHQARRLAELSQSGLEFHDLEDLAAALSLPLDRLQPLAPILQFCCYDAPPLIDLNSASLEQLLQVPGLEATLAVAILQERQQGSYRSLLDLQQRLHWSTATTSRLMHYLRLS